MSVAVALKRQGASANLNPQPPAGDQLQDSLASASAPPPSPVVAEPPKLAAPVAHPASRLTLGQAYNDYADAFNNFCSKEAYCGESSEFLRSVDAGRDQKTVYNRFIKAGSSRELNLPAAIRLTYDALAKKNQYDRMDFTAARAEIWAMLERDLPRRFGDSKYLKAAVPAT